jgi:type I restriction enzyme S subunit
MSDLFADSQTGTALKQLPVGNLKRIKIPLPPLHLQKQFAAIAHKFERLRARQREAERQAEHLFQALLERAFTRAAL